MSDLCGIVEISYTGVLNWEEAEVTYLDSSIQHSLSTYDYLLHHFRYTQQKLTCKYIVYRSAATKSK